MPDKRRSAIGLSDGVKTSSFGDYAKTLDDDEAQARSNVEDRSFVLFLADLYSSIMIFLRYLISIGSLLTVVLTIGLTYYWSYAEWDHGNLDYVLLTFAVVAPLSNSLNTVFQRREKALDYIATFRALSIQFFLSQTTWGWNGKESSDLNSVGHADEVLRELISIADELCRFLTLPTLSTSRHRMTKSGRQEAAQTAVVAYRMYDSLSQRFISLSILSDQTKLAGLGPSEASRVRQYEQKMWEGIEKLRMIKCYRTSRMQNTLFNIFTLVLPPFFASSFGTIGVREGEYGYAIMCALCLHALFEGAKAMEDPFVGFVSLDGIDVREELRVLHWHQLVNARNSIFPSADKFSEKEGLSEQGGKGAEKSEYVKQGSKNAEHEEYCEKGSKEAENETNIKLDTSQDAATVPEVDIEVPAPVVNSARKRTSRGSIMYRRGSSVLGDDAFLPRCTKKNDVDQLLYSRKSAFELQSPDDFGTKWAVLER